MGGGGTGAGLGRPPGQAAATTCLGVSGERGLFESLSAGGEGAFVVWVKGGHETRQECKRLVTDVLDLLATPVGQKEAFFRRGVQEKGPPRGRVGIAAKKSKEATISASQAVPLAKQEISTGDMELSKQTAASAIKGGEELVALNDEGGVKPMVEDDGTCAGLAANIAADDVGAEGTNTLGQGTGGGGGRGLDTEEGGKRRDAAEGKRPGTTYGYASLRKIKEQEPLPMVQSLPCVNTVSITMFTAFAIRFNCVQQKRFINSRGMGWRYHGVVNILARHRYFFNLIDLDIDATELRCDKSTLTLTFAITRPLPLAPAPCDWPSTSVPQKLWQAKSLARVRLTARSGVRSTAASDHGAGVTRAVGDRTQRRV